jgi:hypothetical protein
MANFQCKKLDPLVVGDIGDYCVECLQSTAFGTGRFVNRISADRDVVDEKGNYLGRRDGAYRVHYECLTDKEKEIMEANNQ